MATFTYRIKGKTNPGNIRIRVKQGDAFDYEISTGLKSKLDHWDKQLQKVKNKATATYKDKVNTKLRYLKVFIEEEYLNEIAIGNEISQKWLKDRVNIFFERPINETDDKKYFLVPFVKQFIADSKGKVKMKLGRPLSDRTVEYYTTTLNKILDFEQEKGIKVKFKNISLEFHRDFVEFLSDKQRLNPNTIGFYVSKLKLFLNAAEVKGIKIHPEFKSPDFYVPSNKTKDIYLNPKEIKAIYDLELNNNDKMNNARDWLIIGLWTGLRVSDLLRLDKNLHIIQSYIEIETSKTGKTVIIPIHPNIHSILKKRNGNFPRKISEQRFNDFIKEVCELAGINDLTDGAKMIPHVVKDKTIYRKTYGKYPKFELVTSHTCRRSFITNNSDLLNPTDTMRLVGHSDLTMTIEYNKKTLKDSAKLLKDKWENS